MTQEISKEEQFKDICGSLFDLWKVKESSYGQGNLLIFGELGILVRCSDKVMRLKGLLWDNHENILPDETIDDTWVDLAVYVIRALMMRRYGV